MKNKIYKLRSALKNKEYKEFLYLFLKFTPFGFIVRFSQFYIVKCEEFTANKLLRPLSGEFSTVIEDFSEQLLNKINTEIPHDLGAMKYRLKKSGDKFKVIMIKHLGTVIAMEFISLDKTMYSPSGYVHDFSGAPLVGLYDEFINQNYRLKGLHIHLIKSAFDFSKKHGLGGVFGEIHSLNKNSLNSHMKLGFKIDKKVTLLRIIGFKILF